MEIDPASREMLQQTTGMRPMRTATGLEAFHRILAMPCDQMLVAEGDLARLRRTLLAGPAVASPAAAPPAAAATVDPDSLAEKTEQYLRKELSETLKVPSHRIDPRAALEDYGIDSMLATRLTNQLEKTFGSLPKTLFFEYQTIRELSGYFTANHAARLTALLTPAAQNTGAAAPERCAGDDPRCRADRHHRLERAISRGSESRGVLGQSARRKRLHYGSAEGALGLARVLQHRPHRPRPSLQQVGRIH
jgi:acyl carrier protein